MDKMKLLEQKFKEAIVYIENLKTEKEKYKQELIDLKLEFDIKENEIKKLKLRYSQTEQNLNNSEDIKLRLNKLLKKIEDFELLKL